MKSFFMLATLCLFHPQELISQDLGKESSLLWEVSGNSLSRSSYLFGTYHFLSNAYVDTLQAVGAAYQATEAVVGELIIDSTLMRPLLEASLLKGTTLKKVLPDTVYDKAVHWFTSEARLDLGQLDGFNPLAVMTAAMAITHQKYYPNQPGEIQLDTYFQEIARRDGKKVLGLETIHRQIHAMYGQLPMQRQIDLLYEAVKADDNLKKLIGAMNKAYVSQNLGALQELMYGSTYEKREMKALLDDRNDYWMQQLPQLMQEQSLFVAVGALHLTGKTGLVEQLRNRGYRVTPKNLSIH